MDGVAWAIGLGGGAAGEIGQNLIPAGSEDQPIVAHGPGMFELLVAGGQVLEDVIDPYPLFGSAGYGFALSIAGDIHPYRAMQALTQQIRVGVGDYLVVLIDDEDIPFAIHACGRVVVVNSGLPPLGVVALQGFLYHGHREPGATRPW